MKLREESTATARLDPLLMHELVEVILGQARK